MTELMVFQNPEFGEVRTLTRDGEPWFVLRDVCDALAIASAKDAFARLDDDERGFAPIVDSAGRAQKTSIINESGLYSVIMRSNKPEAKPFRKWVTSEVLPSIRKTGGYTAKPMTLTENVAAQAQILLRCLRQRRKEAGDRYKDYMALTKLDAIALDKKLRVAFEGIVARETARAVKK